MLIFEPVQFDGPNMTEYGKQQWAGSLHIAIIGLSPVAPVAASLRK